MKHALLIAGLALLSGPLHAQVKDIDSSAWEKDYQKAMATARRTGKPVFLVFR